MELKDKISFAINQIPINNCDGSPNDDAIKAIRLLQEAHSEINTIKALSWVPFIFDIIESRPPTPGKYLITRKDGKNHWEQWNGSGWAYNHNEIRYWAKINSPIKFNE